MRNCNAVLRAGMGGAGLFSFANLAFAGAPSGGGLISFVPVTGVPTLSEWALIVMCALMALMAFRVLRSRNLGRLSAWLLGAGVFALASMSGVDLVKHAQAIGAIILSSPNGQTLAIVDGGNQIDNTSGVSQRVSSIVLDAGVTSEPTMSDPRCTVGLVVPNGQSCFIRLLGPPL